jgi:hypothetical protein
VVISNKDATAASQSDFQSILEAEEREGTYGEGGREAEGGGELGLKDGSRRRLGWSGGWGERVRVMRGGLGLFGGGGWCG